ncbi:hypothetical protein HOY80DRAFT_944732 [Tuber brumale]|nr:hypothetical protein HOY80DRAFT_944732 [Tuber brumale]
MFCLPVFVLVKLSTVSVCGIHDFACPRVLARYPMFVRVYIEGCGWLPRSQPSEHMVNDVISHLELPGARLRRAMN